MRIIALILTLASITSLLAQSSSSYRVTHTYTLGGDGSWDYIVPDPPNHRLLAHLCAGGGKGFDARCRQDQICMTLGLALILPSC
jgi:hypothetical protein